MPPTLRQKSQSRTQQSRTQRRALCAAVPSAIASSAIATFFAITSFTIISFTISWPQIARAEEALSPPAQRGLVFVRTHCAKCHSVDRIGASPLPVAPPFRTLHQRYPVETLQELLAEGIVTGHPSMPEFQLDPGQVNDVIAYLKSLEN